MSQNAVSMHVPGQAMYATTSEVKLASHTRYQISGFGSEFAVVLCCSLRFVGAAGQEERQFKAHHRHPRDGCLQQCSSLWLLDRQSCPTGWLVSQDYFHG